MVGSMENALLQEDMIDAMIRLERALKEHIKALKV